jgi:hypothetical protein
MKSSFFIILLFFVVIIGCDDSSSSSNQNNTNNTNNTNNYSLCDGVICSNHGDCVVIQNLAICECEEGYIAEGQSCIEENNAPVITNLPATEMGEWGKSDTFSLLSTDSNIQDILSYSITSNSCTFSPTIDSQGIISWTCQDVESCEVLLTVTDDGTPQMSDSETLSIVCVNTIPDIHSTPDNTGVELIPYSYNISCIDPEGDSLTLSVGLGDTCGATITPNGAGIGTYSFIPSETMGGGYCSLHITCSDGVVTESQSISIAIEEVNIAPIITTPNVTASGLWGSHNSYQMVFSDADLPAQTMWWSISNTNCSFVPTIDASGLVDWTCDDIEACDVEIMVTDSGTPLLDATGILTIECLNSAPAISSIAQGSIDENSLYTYSINCNDSDGNSVSIEYGIGDTCAGILTDNDDGTGSYSFTPSEIMGGTTCDMSIVCSDFQEETTQFTTITIFETNEVPIITTTPMSVTTHWNDSDIFEPAATDNDIPVQGITWSLANNTCSFTPVISPNSGVISWSCIALENCDVDVYVTDDGSPLKSSFENLPITCSNNAPIVNSTPVEDANELSLYTHDLECNDPDSDQLEMVFGANHDCGGSLVDHGDGTAQFTFTPAIGTADSTCTLDVVCTDTQVDTSQTSSIYIDACKIGYCSTQPADSCMQIKTLYSDAQDDIYWIDSDGSGPIEPFQIYCIHSVDGGGWTVMAYLKTPIQWDWEQFSNNGILGDTTGGFNSGTTLATDNSLYSEKIIIYRKIVEYGTINLGQKWMVNFRTTPVPYSNIREPANWSYRDSYGTTHVSDNACTHSCDTYRTYGMFSDYANFGWHGTQGGDYGCRDGNNICWQTQGMSCNVGGDRCANLTDPDEGVIYAIR